ncbi:MAG: hypothetical protein LBU87_04030, partial [Lactobacillales bacterium]|nr:hypothetical protein [Lactobacillales bacterium]
MKKHLLLSCLVFSFSGAVWASENLIDLNAQKELSITIYNQDRALVQDERNAALSTGVQDIAFQSVSDQLIAESALMIGKDISVLEQNFNYDMLSYYSMMNKSVGDIVTVEQTNPATGAIASQKATLMAFDGGSAILKVGDQIKSLGQNERISFSKIPDNLRAKPTLVVKIDSKLAGDQTLNLRYLTRGLSWDANYIAQLSDDETQMDLNGFITLNNRSGIPYKNAKVNLVAGDVNTVARYVAPRAMMAKGMAMETGMLDNAMPASEALGDFHLYSLPQTTDVLSNQTKQVALLSKQGVKVQKVYEYRNVIPTQGEVKNVKPNIFMTFENEKENALGIPLPKGVMRFYKNNSSGASLFVGEDTIDHTPNKQQVRLKMGQAFDIFVNAKQTERVKLSEKSYRATYEVTINNGSEKMSTVTIYQSFPTTYRMVSETIASTKETANMHKWVIPVLANSEKTFTYTI